MLRRLLLVEDGPEVCRHSVEHILTPELGFDCTRKSWESIDPSYASLLEADLVVLADSANPELTGNLFNWLREHPVRAPTVAVFPPDATIESLRLAAEIVDDFVFAPVRGEEFCYRVKRMLGCKSEPDVEHPDLHDLKQKLGLAQLIGEDAAFARVIQAIPGIAASSAPRDTTKRPEAVDAGSVKLVGTDVQTIVQSANRLLDDPEFYQAMAQATNPFGDGYAALRIMKHLQSLQPAIGVLTDSSALPAMSKR